MRALEQSSRNKRMVQKKQKHKNIASKTVSVRSWKKLNKI